MKTLVTGATGFLGSALVRRLVMDQVPVRILRRPTSQLDLLGPAAEQVEHAVGDVTDVDSLRDAMAGIEQVYHTAALVVFNGRKDRDRLRRVDLSGTANVVNTALDAGVRRFVHTSSIAAVGRPAPGHVLDEKALWQSSRMNTEYARSKYEAELEVHRGIAEGLDAVIVNPSLIFGPGRRGENTMLIVEQLKRRKLPGIPVGGANVVDVDDVADGHVRAMERGRTGERYILGSENLSWRAIMTQLAEALQVDPPRLTVPRKPAMALAVLSEALAWLTRSKPLLTRESVRTASGVFAYTNDKAVTELGCVFRPFSETARRIAAQWSAEF